MRWYWLGSSYHLVNILEPSTLPLPCTSGAVSACPSEMVLAWVHDLVAAEAAATPTRCALADIRVLAVLVTACQGNVAVGVRVGYSAPDNVYVVMAQPPGTSKCRVFTDLTAPLEGYETEHVDLIADDNTPERLASMLYEQDGAANLGSSKGMLSIPCGWIMGASGT